MWKQYHVNALYKVREQFQRKGSVWKYSKEASGEVCEEEGSERFRRPLQE